MTRKLILEGWSSYRREVIPAAAPAGQVEDCRRAFYAGALNLFTSIANMLDPGAEPTRKDLEQMEAIAGELRVYGAEMTKRARAD